MSDPKLIERVEQLARGVATFEDVISQVSVMTVLETSPDGVLVVNENGQIIYASQRAHSMFRYPQGFLVGKKVEILVPEALHADHAKHREKFNRRPASRMMGVDRKLAGVCRTGEKLAVEISLSPIDTMEGSVVIAYVREPRAAVI